VEKPATDDKKAYDDAKKAREEAKKAFDDAAAAGWETALKARADLVKKVAEEEAKVLKAWGDLTKKGDEIAGSLG